MIDFITFCDYTGTFAFAISGIRLASAKQFDWFGAYVVGVVTAVGGGTIRDILLNAVPFWMEQASYLIISALALLLLFGCLGLGFVVRYRFPKIRDPFEQYIFYIRCYRIGVVCGGRYRQDLGFRVPHVGGDRDGNHNRLVWRYDEGYID